MRKRGKGMPVANEEMVMVTLRPGVNVDFAQSVDGSVMLRKAVNAGQESFLLPRRKYEAELARSRAAKEAHQAFEDGTVPEGAERDNLFRRSLQDHEPYFILFNPLEDGLSPAERRAAIRDVFPRIPHENDRYWEPDGSLSVAEYSRLVGFETTAEEMEQAFGQSATESRMDVSRLSPEGPAAPVGTPKGKPKGK